MMAYGPDPGDGLKPRRQFFGELRQFLVDFGESGGEVFDCQCEALGFGAGDADHGAGAV
jgi:hypothetical protein